MKIRNRYMFATAGAAALVLAVGLAVPAFALSSRPATSQTESGVASATAAANAPTAAPVTETCDSRTEVYTDFPVAHKKTQSVKARMVEVRLRTLAKRQTNFSFVYWNPKTKIVVISGVGNPAPVLAKYMASTNARHLKGLRTEWMPVTLTRAQMLDAYDRVAAQLDCRAPANAALYLAITQGGEKLVLQTDWRELLDAAGPAEFLGVDTLLEVVEDEGGGVLSMMPAPKR